MKQPTRKLVLAALLMALCFVGANLKVMGTIAFDSLPAFLGSLILGWGWGAAIGAAGHLLTALTSGFPLGLPIHLATAAMMAVTMAAFAGVVRFVAFVKGSRSIGYIVAVFTAAVVNGPVSLAALMPLLLPVLGMGGVLAMVPPLTLVAAVNAALAVVVYRVLPGKFKQIESKQIDKKKRKTNENH